jgi:hypothetical protein
MRLPVFAAAAATFAVIGCHATASDDYAALPAVGSQVPVFRYAEFDGSTVTPESLRGRPALLALWATTCSASRLALTSLAKLHGAYALRGAHVMILADDHDSAAVATVFLRAGVHTPVALGAGTLMDAFTHGQSILPWRKAFALPTFLVLDATGRVVYRQIGIEQDARNQLARVRYVLDSLLASPTPGRVGVPTT